MTPSQHNRDPHEPVAIIGMGCRWPGGVHDTSQFWEFLRDKTNGWKEFDGPRFSTQGFHHPSPDRPGSISMKGAFLAKEDARLFDHAFFGMTGLEVETMDPSQRKLLEVSYEAIENAGETWDSVSGSRTGVFVGNFCLDHWMIQSRDWDNPRPYAFTGAGTSILANRISYIFNLQGPSLTVDTACSSSMYALHLAVNSIRAGDCDAAIVASANWIADPGVQIALDKLGALSASSRCHTFDARAEGYARGEGYGAIYLKRPSLAVADSSPIRAIIRGTAINSNGRTGGITRPSARGQEMVIREAYRSAGDLPFRDTSYFECHGTGTYVGDPIEVAALGRVFAPERSADDPLLVGSVKSNVGHGEGASALASIMKVVLSLENGAIAPLFDLQTRNPNIDFQGANVLPVTEVTPWPKDRPQRASINSFGYGGANAHCIIEHVSIVLPDYVAPGVYQRKANGHTNGHTNGYTNGTHQGEPREPLLGIQRPTLAASPNAATRQLVLLPLSAHTERSFESNLAALSRVIDKVPLANVAYTLGSRRSRFAQRSFRVVDRDSIAQGLATPQKIVRAPLQTANLGFIFTGQGAQWHGMGRELFEFRVFRTAIEDLDRVLGSLANPPSWSLLSILSGDCEDVALVQTAEISQAVCTAAQIGLVDLLASWSIRPSGVAGHSSGEIAAAYAAGRITAAEAIVAAYLRGQAVAKNSQKGAMLAVGLGVEQVSPYLDSREDEVKVAAINSPGSVTLSGEPAAIKDISAAMTADGVFNRQLQTGGNAYHSHHMLPIGREYSEMLAKGLESVQDVGPDSARRRRYEPTLWISSVTPAKSTTEFGDAASYWRANLESPVLFSEAVTRLVSREDVPINVLVEIGPHPALKTPLEQILKDAGKTVSYASTLKRQEDGRRSVLQCVGTLFCLNASVDLAAVNAVDIADGTRLEHGHVSSDLPPYQYTYGGLNYHESRASKEYRHRSILRHDLLGSKVVGNAKLRPQWRNILRMKDVPWLGDHRLVPDAVLPAAAYVAMAVEAALRAHAESGRTSGVEGLSLRNMDIKKSLVIPEDDYGVEILTSMELVDESPSQPPAWATFSISSVKRDTDEWTEHSTGRIKIHHAKADKHIVDKHQVHHASRAVDAQVWYNKFLDIGLGYGPVFQPLSDIRVDPVSGATVATIDLQPSSSSSSLAGGESRYPVHPASLDGAIQLGLIACHKGRPDEASTAFLPVQIPRLYISNAIAQDVCTVTARGTRRGIRSAHLDLQMLGPDGEVLVSVEKLRCVSYSSEARPAGADDDDTAFSSPFTRLVWRPDIRMLTNRQARQLYPPPEQNVQRAPLWGITNRVAHLVILSIYESFGKLVGDVPKPSGDVGHFFDWVKRKAQNDDSDAMREARGLAAAVVDGGLPDKIDELVGQAGDVVEVQIAKLLHDHAADILFERRTGMDVIIGAGLLTPLYQSGLLMTGIYPQLSHVLEGLAHASPNARVLEIGGGTGGATRIAMKAFAGPNGVKAYRDYTFTDISAGFLSSARESLAGFHDMHFSVLDVEADPLGQGYQAQAYDLVIACQVLHATSNMHRTLSHCRRLLRPGGKLVLVETNRNFTVPGIVVGTFTGYWAGIPDGRVDAPFQSLAAWESSLRDAGFSGLDLVLDDFPEPHNTTSVMVSTVLAEPRAPPPPPPSAAVHLLHGSSGESLTRHIADELERWAFEVTTGPLDAAPDSVTPGSRVVALCDDEHLLVDGAGDQGLRVFQHLSRTASSMLVVTSCGAARGRNADGALLPGLLRVLQNENPASRYASVDVDADDFNMDATETADLARQIAQLLDDGLGHAGRPAAKDDGETETGPDLDREFAWQDGCLWVSRHIPDGGFHSQHGLDGRKMKPELLPLATHDGGVRAAFETPGVPGSLYFRPYNELHRPIPPGYIDVTVEAVGVSDRDIDTWTGRRDGDHFSSEYAGVVTSVSGHGPTSDPDSEGAGSTHGFRVGDRVYGLGKGQLGNRTRVPAAFACRLAQGHDAMGAASMPLAYATAVYALEHVAHLRKGTSVLVQAGAGDAATASIILARAKGADVFVAAETPEQVSFLVDNLVVPASHVIEGHGLDRLRQVAQKTRRGGFDAVICTSSYGSDVPSALLEVLAPLGRLIDVGGRGADSQTLELLPPMATYSVIDALAIFDADPALGAELMESVGDYHRKGLIGPLPGITTVDVGRLPSALRDAADKAPGKLVVCFQDPGSLVRMVTPAPAARLDPEACYVVTGALGGVGQSLVGWMADRGARHLALLSRRAASSVPGAAELISSLTGRGVQVECFACDVSNKGDVADVMQRVSSRRPVRGVVHAAVSYLDLSFDKVEAARWREGLAAKVQGTRNLHEATLAMPLDFFVMTTSALSLYGFATQGAYTAANSFQDAFARYRRRLGLPASTVSFGLIREATAVGTDATTIDLFERNRAATLSESQFLTLLGPAFLDNQTSHAADPAQWPGRQQDPLSCANLHTYLDPRAMARRRSKASSSAVAPRWHGDARASLMMRAARDCQQLSDQLEGSPGEASLSTTALLRAELAAAVAEGAAGRPSAVALAQGAIVKAVAEMLFVDAESIDPAKSVADLGVDSLIAAELRNWFLQALGANISMLDLLDPAVGISKRATDIVDGALSQSLKA
ncbi:Prosolanapyrone synthase [Colletotrichum gloeosporioides]|uniref:Prosolanapyrone synthase n=1 Tax=Colletotrichum gloeosporioides TaxID=474922 RepID=A0A8H4CMQ6_COLGL|nr:Prosolanapyrone synthase [Colletotrichum gloeosporioides]KAF3806818.1 Prosolanapyrone synthase [Colletotrichum gloeosporioides]